ncbi:MAG: hypothetical protein ACRDL2_00230 [Gaiellaceae bacterium]
MPLRPAPEPVSVSRARTATFLQRLAAFLALDMVASLAALAAVGGVDGAPIRIAIAVAACGVVASVFAFRHVGAPTVPARCPAKPFRTTKAILVLLIVTGIAAYFGAGTFAGFDAVTANPASAIASGTLTMNDTVDTGTACMSIGGAAHDNVNAGCDAALSLDNQEPGLSHAAEITVQNSGSLDASELSFGASYVNGTLGSDLDPGTITSLSLASPGLEGPVANGDTIEVSYGEYAVDFTASANASAGATTVSVSSQSITDTLAAGATVVDTSSDTTAGVNTDCYDQRTTVPGGGVIGATVGTDLNFNPVTNNPLCAALLVWVQEIGTGHNYCWYGNTTNAPAGACNAPIYVNLPSGQTIDGTTTSIPVDSLSGNVAQNDTILVTEGATQSSCTASAAVYISPTATSIPVGGCTPGGGNTFTTAAVVTDSTTLTNLTGDTHTITSFDTATKPSSQIELTPVSADGTTAATGTDLPHYDGGSTDTRTFYVGVYFPLKATQQNVLQGLMSTFGLTWQLTQ